MKEQIYACCKELRLSTTFAENAMSMSGDTPQEYLLKVLEAEIDYRNTKRKKLHLKQAGFDNLKTFEGYDFDHIVSNRQIMMRSDIKLLQPFASWSNSLEFTCDF